MNRSYQVALLIVVIICAGIIVYAISGGGADPAGTGEGDATARGDASGADDAPIEISPDEPREDRPTANSNTRTQRNATDQRPDPSDAAAPAPPTSSESLIERIRRLQASDVRDDTAPAEPTRSETATETPAAATTASDPATESRDAAPRTGGDEMVDRNGSSSTEDQNAPNPDTAATTQADPSADPTMAAPTNAAATDIEPTDTLADAEEDDREDGSTIASTERLRSDTNARRSPPTDPSPVDTPAEPTAPEAPQTYTIKAGDTFERIAEKLYGSKQYWDEIGKANPFVDPTRLKVGQVIDLPQPESIDDTEPAAGSRADELAGSTGTIRYRVRTGDNLWSIAKQYYGDGSKWRRIGEANRDKLGDNFDRLRVGDELIIPPPEAQR